MRNVALFTLVSSLIALAGVVAAVPPRLPVAEPETEPARADATASGEDLIAFYSDRDGNSEIYVMDPEGGSRTRLTFNAWDDQAPSWSPDGRTLVYSANASGRWQVWMIDADGTDPHAVTATGSHELASDWSPDGSLIAFVSSRNDPDPDGCYPSCTWQIYVMNPDGTGQRRLITSSGSDEAPRWSPDGTRLVYFSRRAGNWDLYVINADGTNERRLTDTPEREALPTWSPDGTQTLYITLAPGSAAHRAIGVMNADGSAMRTLVDGPGLVNEDPVWSPDGSRIAFQSDRDGTYQIYVMDADGSNQHNLSNNHANEFWPNWRPRPAATDGSRPVRRHLARPVTPPRQPELTFTSVRQNRYWDISLMNVTTGQTRRITRQSSMHMACDWTHDGSRLALMTNRDGNYEIYSMAADGSDWRRLTDTHGDDQGPEWSPDGGRIAYAEDVGGGTFQIFVAEADGANRVQLTSGTNGSYAPAWSPDGGRIAYVSGGRTIRVMDGDGDNAVTLVSDSADKLPTDWSPDGSRIMFMSRQSGIYKLFTVRLADGAIGAVPTGAYDAWSARWSPDGSLIAFYSYGIGSAGYPNGMFAVFLMNADGSDLRQVTTLTAADRSWHPSWRP